MRLSSRAGRMRTMSCWSRRIVDLAGLVGAASRGRRAIWAARVMGFAASSGVS